MLTAKISFISLSALNSGFRDLNLGTWLIDQLIDNLLVQVAVGYLFIGNWKGVVYIFQYPQLQFDSGLRFCMFCCKCCTLTKIRV